MPTKIGGTRWLPHTERALENYWKGKVITFSCIDLI
jgi:hypothetical protein